MKRVALMLLSWPPLWSAAPQIVCSLGSGALAYTPSSDQRPTPDALTLSARTFAAAKTICGATCPQVVLFRNPTAANLMVIPTAGQAKIVYAPQAFEATYENFGDPGIMALLAHAIGHALDDAIGVAWVDQKSPPELRADAFAGCTLARASLTSTEMSAALAALAEFPSPAHPAWNVRLAAIRNGYSHCGGSATF